MKFRTRSAVPRLRAWPTVLVVGLTWALAFPASSDSHRGPGGPPGHGPGPGHGPPPIERMIEHLADELGLDDETRARVEALSAKGRERQQTLRAELRQKHEEMRGLLSEPDPDEATVMQQAEAIGALETESQKARLRTLLAVRAVLTPEQREKLTAIHAERRASHQRALGQSCEPDLERLCPDAAPGREQMSCLRRAGDGLSSACSEAVQSLRRHRPGGHRGGPRPR